LGSTEVGQLRGSNLSARAGQNKPAKIPKADGPSASQKGQNKGPTDRGRPPEKSQSDTSRMEGIERSGNDARQAPRVPINFP
jgi:hypothetical protein